MTGTEMTESTELFISFGIFGKKWYFNTFGFFSRHFPFFIRSFSVSRKKVRPFSVIYKKVRQFRSFRNTCYPLGICTCIAAYKKNCYFRELFVVVLLFSLHRGSVKHDLVFSSLHFLLMHVAAALPVVVYTVSFLSTDASEHQLLYIHISKR